MSAIRWQSFAPRPLSLPFLNSSTWRHVILCTPPTGLCLVSCHFLGPKQSAPCFTADCPHCLRGDVSELHAYACTLFFDRGERKWKRGVLGCGNPYGELGSRDWRGQVLELGRNTGGGGKKGALIVRHSEPLAPHHPSEADRQWFDVRPRLLERWNMPATVEDPLPLFAHPSREGERRQDDAPPTPSREHGSGG